MMNYFGETFKGVKSTNDQCISLLEYFLEKYPKLLEEDYELQKVIQHLKNMNFVFDMWAASNAQVNLMLENLSGVQK